MSYIYIYIYIYTHIYDISRLRVKEEFSAAFQKVYDRAKACIYANGAYFELKKVCVFLICLRFKKKISPKTFGPHCVPLFQILSLRKKRPQQ